MLLKINKLQFIFVAVFSASSSNVLTQAIVNIEDLRREGEIGFFTNISASLDASRGNRDRDYYSRNSGLIITLKNQSLFLFFNKAKESLTIN